MQDQSVILRYGNTHFNAPQQADQFYKVEEAHLYRKKYREAEQQRIDTEKNLKSGVFKNYPTFIRFAEEIKKMDTALEELQSSLDNTEQLLIGLKHIDLNVSEEKVQKVSTAGAVPDSLLWLKDVSDDMEIFIYQRRYVDAVELALKARQAFSESTEEEGELYDLVQSVQKKIDELITLLIDELQNNAITSADSRRFVRLLVSLGEREIAQRLFLNYVQNEIDNQSHQLAASGDTLYLIKQLCESFFEILHDSGLSWQSLFSDAVPADDAIFLSWMVKELDKFIKLLFLFAFEKKSLDKVTEVTSADYHTFCSVIAPLLSKAVQMDELGYCLIPYILHRVGKYISKYTQLYLSSICNAIKNVNVKTLIPTTCKYVASGYQDQKPVSTFANTIYEQLFPFVLEVSTIITSETLIYISPIFNKYMAEICVYVEEVYKEKRESNKVGSYHPLLADLLFLSETYLVYIQKTFENRFDTYQFEFDQSVADLISALQAHVESIYLEIDNYLVETYYLPIDETPSAPSDIVLTMITNIQNFFLDLEKVIDPIKIPNMRNAVYKEIFSLMNSDSHWSDYDSKFLVNGYYALCLDVYTLLQAAQMRNGDENAYAIMAKGGQFAHSDPPKERWIQKNMTDSLNKLNIPILEIPLVQRH